MALPCTNCSGKGRVAFFVDGVETVVTCVSCEGVGAVEPEVAEANVARFWQAARAASDKAWAA